MNATDVIGFIGVLLILIGYFLNLNNKLDANDIRYILINLVGAILACLASILMQYYPFILLEGTWTIVSLVALIKYLRDKNKASSNNRRKDLQTAASISSLPPDPEGTPRSKKFKTDFLKTQN